MAERDHQVDLLDVLAVVSPNGEKPVILSDALFLSALAAIFQIEIIWCTGSGHDAFYDSSLKRVFALEQIIYSDQIQRSDNGPKGVFYHARHNEVPLEPESVDAIYSHDSHATREDFAYMIGKLKPGGIIISGFDCSFGEKALKSFRSFTVLKPVDLPFESGSPEIGSYSGSGPMIVFQKNS